jgi:CRP-like cAMP-binding protein
MEQYLDVILQNPLFHNIATEDLKALLGCLNARLIRVAKGDPVFLEGDPAGFIGMVLEGGVQVVRDGYYGERTLLSHAQAGELFAEAFACAGVQVMPVSAYALRASTVALFDLQKMLTVCTNGCRFHNLLIRNLVGVVAEKNLQLGTKIRYMSCKTTKEKLLAYLLDQAKLQDSDEFTIPLDRQTLADYLGVERSAMSAELSKLKAAGIMDYKGSRFRLLKKQEE